MAATRVVPDPANGSRARSPDPEQARTTRSVSASGIWVGCPVRSGLGRPAATLGMCQTSLGFLPRGAGISLAVTRLLLSKAEIAELDELFLLALPRGSGSAPVFASGARPARRQGAATPLGGDRDRPLPRRLAGARVPRRRSKNGKAAGTTRAARRRRSWPRTWLRAYDQAVQVLGSLLPGVREVRAPLAAGYTWLLVAWLVYGSDASQHPTGLALDLRRLHDTVSTAGAAVALGFVAYMIGVFSIALTGVLARWVTGWICPLVAAWTRRNRFSTPWAGPSWWFSDYAPRTSVALESVVAPRLEQAYSALCLPGRDDDRPPDEQLSDLVERVARRGTGGSTRVLLCGRDRRVRADGPADDRPRTGAVRRVRPLAGRGGAARRPVATWSGVGRDASVDRNRGLASPRSRRNRGGGGARLPRQVRTHDAVDVVVSALRNGRVDSPVLARLRQETDQIVQQATGAGPASVGISDAPRDNDAN